MESRLHEQYAKFSPNNQVTKAIAYSLNCWDAIQHGAVIRAPHSASLSMRDLTTVRSDGYRSVSGLRATYGGSKRPTPNAPESLAYSDALVVKAQQRSLGQAKEAACA